MFNFLKDLQAVSLEANPTKEKAAKSTSQPRLEKNPTNGADFRIMGTGKIYPSAKFVADFNLEYTPKDSNTISNGFDLFPSSQWGNYPKTGPDLLLGYAVRMDLPKIELFAGVRHAADGQPINSVMDQGTTLSNETLDMIADAFGIPDSDGGSTSPWENLLVSLAKEGEAVARYVDFYVAREVNGVLTMPDGIYNIPKRIERGEKKGTITTTRREKVNVLPVVLFTDDVAQQLAENERGELHAEINEGEEVGVEEMSKEESSLKVAA